MKQVMMKIVLICLAAILSAIQGCGSDNNDPVQTIPSVTKTNPMKLYMHYMPWFQSKPVSGFWGSHWTMTNRNPDVVDEDGKRQIASHYYPLIGPYDSKDPDVIEYHLLLMKYAGIDGVLIDWYGTYALNDYRVNLIASNALIDKLGEVGIQFAIVYEEYTAGIVEDKTSITAIDAARTDVKYIQDNYFSKPEYIRINDSPLLLTFGPRFFRTATQWGQIFSALSAKPKFLPLWNHTSYTGAYNNGEFSWVDFNESLNELTSFYNKKPYAEILIGSAYPGFHDYYEEGGTGTSYGYMPALEGATLQNTLNRAKARNIDYLQLVTWNDFGEGTAIEPTSEDGFSHLERIQQFAGVTYTVSDLEVIYSYYLKKKALKGNTAAEQKLATVFQQLVALRVNEAKELLNQIN